MRQKIYCVKDHPEFESLKEYASEVAEGTYQVRLDYHAWGKSTNLFCYFTDTDSGDRFRLSVFSRSSYKPYNDGPTFDEKEIGGLFEINTAISKNGLPKFMAARKL